MKNKIKLIVFLIPLVLLSTGCQATYQMTVTDKEIEETLSISETPEKSYQNAYYSEKNTLEGFYNSSVYLRKYFEKRQEEYINNYYINKDNFDRDNTLRQNSMYSDSYKYLLSNVKEYSLKNNSFINNIIKDSLIINDENIIVHVDNVPSNLLKDLDNLTINITTQLPVVSNNADSVDENTYTWNYDKTNNLTKSISLYIERPKIEEDNKTNNKQNNSSTRKDNTVYSIIVAIVIYLVIIIFVINFFNKKKKLF